MVHGPLSFQQLRATFRQRRKDRIQAALSNPASLFELRRFTGTLCHEERLTRPLRLAHLSDLHVGLVTPLPIQLAAIELALAQRPDVIVITGDFVCHSQTYLDDLCEAISAINVPIFGVMGNHDYWSGATGVRRALRRAGMEVLDNANTVIELKGQRLQLVGLDDAYTGHSNLRKACKGMRKDLPTVGLSHIAEEADGLWHANVPLVLSGHTHGGQVTVARLHELTLGRVAGHRYIHGLYGCRQKQAQRGAVYVTAGIGASVMPLRLGDRGQREITLFELGVKPGSFTEHHQEQAAHPGRDVSPRTMARRQRKVARRDTRHRQKHNDS